MNKQLDSSENSKILEMASGLTKLFEQRAEFIVIGLTGQTGSGCSSAAEILQKNFSDLQLRKPANPLPSNDERKYSIVREWAEIKWNPFKKINIGSIIFAIFAELPEENISDFIQKYYGAKDIFDAMKCIKSIKNLIDELGPSRLGELYEGMYGRADAEKEYLKLYDFYFDQLPTMVSDFRNALNRQDPSIYTKIMQEVGNNIRRSGHADQTTESADNIFFIPKCVNTLIKIGRKYCEFKKVPGYFVIDALRNPLEIEFFRGRYSAFYCFAITTHEDSRVKRLHALNYNDSQISDLSKKEYPTGDAYSGYDMLVSQHIGKCLELSDVIVENPESSNGCRKRSELTESLVRYISLIQHPGLVSPERVERCMQIAVTAKLNSGCISRQVGAVVTDSGYSIRAVGWNNVPEGQVPCNLRNVKRIEDGSDELAFSEFEKSQDQEGFANYLTRLPHFKVQGYSKDGLPLAYCFKSVYNKSKGDRNQVHTRSLHAEENAFLQIAKCGGQALTGGILFSTASPCELCSKKAYQLGIKDIFYIDPYPGIASKHILLCGERQPNLKLFTGAIGRAYIQLYQPLIPLKDELGVLLTD